MLRMFVYMKTLDEEIVEQQKSYTEMDFLGMCYLYFFFIYWCSLNREALRQAGEQRTIYFDHPTRRSTLWTLPDLRTL